MKHKILSMITIAVLMTVFSCTSKPAHENQEATPVDTAVVKPDSTSSTEPLQDTLQSN